MKNLTTYLYWDAGTFNMARGFIGLIIFLITASLCLVSSATYAGKIYKWIDKNGQVHYSQKNPGNKQKQVLELKKSKQIPKIEEIPNRYEKQKCVSIKCIADKMESDRLQKEAKRRNNRKTETRVSGTDQRNALKLHRDKIIIDKCKERREVYCDEGVEKIKNEEEWKRIKQEQQKQFLRDHPYIPRNNNW